MQHASELRRSDSFAVLNDFSEELGDLKRLDVSGELTGELGVFHMTVHQTAYFLPGLLLVCLQPFDITVAKLIEAEPGGESAASGSASLSS
jgi:hypothetical protein